MDEKLKTPSELDFLESFGIEPTERRPSDGFWSYGFSDANGLSVELSFDKFARSVQASLHSNEIEIATILLEGALRIWIENSLLKCEFVDKSGPLQLDLQTKPRLALSVVRLITRE